MTFHLYYVFIILAQIQSDFMGNRYNFKLNCSSKVHLKVQKNLYYKSYTIIIHNKYLYKIVHIITDIFYADQRKLIPQTLPTTTQ